MRPILLALLLATAGVATAQTARIGVNGFNLNAPAEEVAAALDAAAALNVGFINTGHGDLLHYDVRGIGRPTRAVLAEVARRRALDPSSPRVALGAVVYGQANLMAWTAEQYYSAGFALGVDVAAFEAEVVNVVILNEFGSVDSGKAEAAAHVIPNWARGFKAGAASVLGRPTTIRVYPGPMANSGDGAGAAHAIALLSPYLADGTLDGVGLNDYRAPRAFDPLTWLLTQPVTNLIDGFYARVTTEALRLGLPPLAPTTRMYFREVGFDDALFRTPAEAELARAGHLLSLLADPRVDFAAAFALRPPVEEPQYLITVDGPSGRGIRAAAARLAAPPPPPPNLPPTAGLTVSVDYLDATFTLTSSDADGQIVSLALDFGDATSTALEPGVDTATHAYPGAGTRTATLTVVDDDGARASASVTVLTTAPPVCYGEECHTVSVEPARTVRTCSIWFFGCLRWRTTVIPAVTERVCSTVEVPCSP